MGQTPCFRVCFVPPAGPPGRQEYYRVVHRPGGPRCCSVWVGPKACLGPTTAAREWSCAVCPMGRSWTTEKIPGEDPSWKDHAECWSGEGPGDSVG
ncbi:hypothetical protein AB205_0158070, partial [Aquarana catesbeiana]